MVEEGLDAVLISSVSNILYLSSFVGFSHQEREAYLLVTKDEQFILTDGRFSQAVKDLGYKLIKGSSRRSHKQVIKQLVSRN